MPKKALLPLLLIAALALLGMGDSGLAGSDTPRTPEKNFTGTVVDRSMTTLHVTHMHCEGKTSVKGYLGEMRITLDFAKIKQVEFYPGTAGYTWGQVTFHEGEDKKLRFKSLARCYGMAEMGQVMVRVKDLKRISFDDQQPQQDQ